MVFLKPLRLVSLEKRRIDLGLLSNLLWEEWDILANRIPVGILSWSRFKGLLRHETFRSIIPLPPGL